MKFKINSVEYEIIELTQKEYKSYRKEEYEMLLCKQEDLTEGIYYGATHSFSNKIFLSKEQPKDRKRKTLIHELTHAYINEYIVHQDKNYDEEMVADIVANSYDIIHDIVNNYFNKKEKK